MDFIGCGTILTHKLLVFSLQDGIPMRSIHIEPFNFRTVYEIKGRCLEPGSSVHAIAHRSGVYEELSSYFESVGYLDE